MAFEFEDGIDTIKTTVTDTVDERTIDLGNAVASIIKQVKKDSPDSLIIDLDCYHDGAPYWHAVRMNVIEGLEKRFRGRITATRSLASHTPLTVWEEVTRGDGCSDRYVKVIFNKE